MTHTLQLKGQFSYNKKQVKWLTGMTEEQYNNFRIDTGKAFIENNYRSKEVELICDNKPFWQWWFYQWNLIDDSWILSELYIVKEPCRHAIYRMMHQYVFDNDDKNQDLLMADFMNVRAAFSNHYPEIE